MNNLIFTTHTIYCRNSKIFTVLIWITFGAIVGWYIGSSYEDSYMAKIDPRYNNFIFIGGHESTGTGLMRILLDVHPSVRCGPEPVVTTSLLRLKMLSEYNMYQLEAAGIYTHVFNRAIAAFISEIIINMGESAERLCHKQPFSFYYLKYLYEIFPRSKFIHMTRDGRAAVASTIRRQVNPLYVSSKPEKAFGYWENLTTIILDECRRIGSSRCITVRYEDLILNTKYEIQRVLNFLDLTWDPIVLKHETVIDKISQLSPYEASSKQVVNKIHRNSLLSWLENNDTILPKQLIETIHLKSKMLHQLGYAQIGFPPNYSLLKPIE
ncbi:unnamed protein product [Trichobilharzia szidati]|nr:unnamed protein product [Trichobilharzia szidati]CAH8837575.1 unnamed protein product [Trichobilharzia szidati]